MVEKIFIADKPTLDAIKKDTTDILNSESRESIIFHVVNHSTGGILEDFVNINGKGVLKHLVVATDTTSIYCKCEVYIDNTLIFKAWGREDNIAGIFNVNFLGTDKITGSAEPLMIGNTLQNGNGVSKSNYSRLVKLPYTGDKLGYFSLTDNGIRFNESLVIKISVSSSYADCIAMVDIE